MPPLRERPGDIPLLVHYFVARYAAKIGRRIARVPADTMRRLIAYPWPGNIRELENVIERAVILSTGSELDAVPELQPPSADVATGLESPEPPRRHGSMAPRATAPSGLPRSGRSEATPIGQRVLPTPGGPSRIKFLRAEDSNFKRPGEP